MLRTLQSTGFIVLIKILLNCLSLISALTIGLAGSASASDGPAAPLKPSIAPLQTAHTFAQVQEGGRTSTLLVVAMGKDAVHAIDLSAMRQHYSADAFNVIEQFSAATLDQLARRTQEVRSYPIDRLLNVGPRGVRHIAAGTNYTAHGEETGLDEAFLFPKLSPATGPRAKVSAAPGTLLDYEVELCARFDREIRSMADFDAARKGFFLCGDFSDRATLVRNLNLQDILSGDGFPDAKSGPDRFPAGALLVVPHDWERFVDSVTISTWVDGKRRQYAQASDMIKDLRTIVQETLAEAGTRTWSFRDGRIPMIERGAIGTDSAILTGTGEGVIFQEPDETVMKSVMGAPDRAAQLVQIERYLAAEQAKRIYLQPGQQVRYESNYLGRIVSDVVASAPSGVPGR